MLRMATNNTSNATEDFIDDFHVSPDVSPLIYNAASVFMVIIFCFGFPANIGIFVLFINSPLIRTPFNLILMNLILAELIISGYGVPVDFIASIQYGWKLGKNACIATAFILTLTGELSIVTLAVLSFQRYLIITKPEVCKITSYKSSGWIILGIWIYVLFIAVPPFFGFGAFVVETSGLTCAPDWESNQHLIYTWYWVITGFLGPMGVILFASLKTLLFIREQTRNTESESVKRMSQKREKKVSCLVIWMDLAFMICWMPYGIVCFCYIFGGKDFVPPTVIVFPLLAAKTSICWNPILYILMNPQFRGAFKRFFKTREEKELEKRWTRINQSADNTRESKKRRGQFSKSLKVVFTMPLLVMANGNDLGDEYGIEMKSFTPKEENKEIMVEVLDSVKEDKKKKKAKKCRKYLEKESDKSKVENGK